MVTKSYVIEATTNASGMKALVDRFETAKQFTNSATVRSLNNYLEMMKRYEGKDAAQVTKYLQGFNAKLDEFKKAGTIKDEAYNTLKESVYYLIGNLAQNKTVEASSTEGNNANYAPAKAVDGFPASRWASEYVDNTWFLVDLDEVKEMDTVRIDWEYARADKYKLLVSNDKQNWINVMPNDGIITAHDGKETIQFNPVKARYMKLQGIKRATDYGYSIYEFGVYNLSGAVDVKGIEGIQVKLDEEAKKVTIDGLLMNGVLTNVKLIVIDPKGKVHLEDETKSTVAGSFQFTFKLTGNLKGTNEAYLSTGYMSEPVKVIFEYSKENPGKDHDK
jgi:hypothetical protein